MGGRPGFLALRGVVEAEGLSGLGRRCAPRNDKKKEWCEGDGPGVLGRRALRGAVEAEAVWGLPRRYAPRNDKRGVVGLRAMTKEESGVAPCNDKRREWWGFAQ